MIKSFQKLVALTAFCVFATSFQAKAAEQTELGRVLEKHVVRVGTVEAAPWYTKDLLTNKWVGIVPDLMEHIFSKHGIKVEYVETQWGTAVAGLQSDRFDLLGAYNETPERAKVIDFTKPIGALKMAVLTFGDAKNYQEWSKVNTPSVRLGAIDGAGATRLLQPILPQTSWVVTPTSDAMFLELESGRVQAVVTSDAQISLYVKKRHKGTMILPQPLYSQPTNIGLRKNSGEFQSWLNHEIDEAKADGSIDKIWSKYVISETKDKG